MVDKINQSRCDSTYDWYKLHITKLLRPNFLYLAIIFFDYRTQLEESILDDGPILIQQVMAIRRTGGSFLKVISNGISTNLNLFQLTIFKPYPDVDLAAWLERVILFSKCHQEDRIEAKDPN